MTRIPLSRAVHFYPKPETRPEFKATRTRISEYPKNPNPNNPNFKWFGYRVTFSRPKTRTTRPEKPETRKPEKKPKHLLFVFL
ncbi:hypothetical protein HanIR_Chr09g0438381 [Helianthus annuus]|nr:hypothetical protein HanIR_Chr09g0438381 [Helianthus annuus]